MFLKKKSVVMNIVNTEDLETRQPQPDYTRMIQEVVRGTAILMGTWVALDTFRQCTVYTASVKILPRVIVESSPGTQ